MVDGARVPTTACNPNQFQFQTSFGSLAGALAHEYVHVQNPNGGETGVQSDLAITVDPRNSTGICHKFAADSPQGSTKDRHPSK